MEMSAAPQFSMLLVFVTWAPQRRGARYGSETESPGEEVKKNTTFPSGPSIEEGGYKMWLHSGAFLGHDRDRIGSSMPPACSLPRGSNGGARGALMN